MFIVYSSQTKMWNFCITAAMHEYFLIYHTASFPLTGIFNGSCRADWTVLSPFNKVAAVPVEVVANEKIEPITDNNDFKI